MNKPPLETQEERVLVCTPTGRDAQLACDVIGRAGLTCVVCSDVQMLAAEIEAGAGTALIAEEALGSRVPDVLLRVLQRQPAWSEFPFVICTAAGETGAFGERARVLFEQLGNVTLLERPLRVITLTSAVRAAVRARRRQNEARELLAQLEHAVRQRDRFLATLGHELRNPLGTIRNAMYLLEELLPPDGPHEGPRALVVRQVEHLSRLIDDLLDVARITAGKMLLQRTSLDVRQVVERAVEAVRVAGQTGGHTVTTRLGAEPLPVHGDAVRLEQIISNLLINAVKYTPSGGHVEVVASREGSEIVVCIRDDGVGISPDILPQIFELFAQADATLDRAQGGMGIGLTLVRGLVELHGGRITATSDGAGRGAEFAVRLPRDASARAPVARAVVSASRVSRRVLVVEDNLDARETLRTLLSLWGHQVEVAEDGLVGVSKALEIHPDVALVDVGLPGLNGYEVARQVRAGLGAAPMLVALSGYGQPEDRRLALEAGFNLHLVKPVSPAELKRLLAA